MPKVGMVGCSKCLASCLYSLRDNIPNNQFIWLKKTNIQLILTLLYFQTLSGKGRLEMFMHIWNLCTKILSGSLRLFCTTSNLQHSSSMTLSEHSSFPEHNARRKWPLCDYRQFCQQLCFQTWSFFLGLSDPCDSLLWHHERLRVTLSDRARITWVIVFWNNLVESVPAHSKNPWTFFNGNFSLKLLKRMKWKKKPKGNKCEINRCWRVVSDFLTRHPKKTLVFSGNCYNQISVHVNTVTLPRPL